MLHNENSSARSCDRSDEKNDDRQTCLRIVRVQLMNDKGSQKDEMREISAFVTYNGITYRPLTTRMRKTDIIKYSDGVVQYTESYCTGKTPDDCGRDCGPCLAP